MLNSRNKFINFGVKRENRENPAEIYTEKIKNRKY